MLEGKCDGVAHPFSSGHFCVFEHDVKIVGIPFNPRHAFPPHSASCLASAIQSVIFSNTKCAVLKVLMR